MIRRIACVLLAAASMVITLPAQAPALDAGVETLTATPLSTWQTNGTVWAIQVVGNVAYVGGSFTSVRPPGAAKGTQEVPRRFVAAFDARTGDLLPWNPIVSGTVATSSDTNCPVVSGTTRECGTVWDMDVTPDGKTLYLGGDFTKVNGQWRMGLAGFDTATGNLSTVYKTGIYGRVMSVTASDSTVYVGGSFTKLSDSTVRTRLAAFNRTTGDALPFAPAADSTVRKMKLTPDGSKLVVGGNFNTINGTGPRRLAAVDPVSGARVSFNDTNNFNAAAWVEDIEVYNGLIYVAGEASGSINEGVDVYDPATGLRKNFDNCLGASHSIAVLRGVVYAGSHSHNCGQMVDGFPEQYQSTDPDTSRRYKLRAEIPTSNGNFQLLNWTPQTDDGNGPREMATVGNDILWVGGEFTLVNDSQPQQGLTRFAYKDAGGVQQAPKRPDAPIVSSSTPGRATVNWSTSEDRDSRMVTYQVIRDGNTSAPVYSVTTETKPWFPGWMSFTDTGVLAGSTHSYTVRGVDPDGNIGLQSAATSITVASAVPAPADVQRLDAARLFYPLDETSGTTVRDIVTGRTMAVGSRVALNQPGVPNLGRAVTLTGLSGGAIVDQTNEWAKKQASVELWFKTSTTVGGRLAGFGNSKVTTGTSSSTDRAIYMTNDGKIVFGSGEPRRYLSSASGLNNGQWHHVVATIDSLAGTKLYVDGTQVGADATNNAIVRWNGYWRIGGDSLSGWASRPASDWFSGSIDQFALYTYPMPAAQVARHATLANAPVVDGQAPSVPAGLTTAVSGKDVSLTWQASTDNDAVAEYRVYKGTTADFTADAGSLLTRTAALSATDTGLTTGTYYYRVAAVDPTGNVSAASDAVAATIAPPPPTTSNLIPTEDTWVNAASPSTTAGNSWVMRSKGGTSPQTSYLKFRVPALPTGTSLQTASLTLTTSNQTWSSSIDPQQLVLVPDSTWSEATMTYATAPPLSATVLGSFTGIGINESKTITLDATALAAYAGQDVTIAIVGGGNDNAEYDTSEAPSGQPVLSVLIG